MPQEKDILAESGNRRFGGENMAKIVIDVGEQMDGATFRLSPKTRVFLSSRFKNLRPPTSVFVSNEVRSDFERYYGPLREQLVMILTGLRESDLQEVGEVEFVDPADGKVLLESIPAR
jgi:hypothetical protein